MPYTIEVDNIKCGGCANSITKGVMEIEGVEAVEVDIEAGEVHVTAPEDTRPKVVKKLATMGYPEKGSVEGLKAMGAKAKSFVSCAVGRMDKE